MSDQQQNIQKEIAKSICKFLRSEIEDAISENRESLEVALQCVESAYGLDNEIEHEYIHHARDLLQVFEQRGPSQLLIEKSTALKEKGNICMKNNEYERAIDYYSSAIQLNPSDAVFYCNRAAAYSRLDRDREALEDSRKAVALDSNYTKAYARLGIAYSNLNFHREARDAYKRAVELDPTNEMYRDNLRLAEEHIQAQPSSSQPSLAGFDLQGFFNNPAVASMAQMMLNNPTVRNAMHDVMQGSQSDAPNVDALLQMGQQLAEQVQQDHPDLANRLRQQFGERPPTVECSNLEEEALEQYEDDDDDFMDQEYKGSDNPSNPGDK